jgi:alpha-beta hydrolase superfamily lysophospholipase
MNILCTSLLVITCVAVSAGAKGSQFRSEEITFKSAGEVALSGSLTLPDGKGPFPAIVLLGGSERLSREAIYKWANADSFVSRGIAVFSFDSPGTGKSEGNRWQRTFKERTDDALAAIKAIRERPDINKESIGLYGASEGGSIVFRAAALSKDVAFGIAVSAPAVPHYEVMNLQAKLLAANTGLTGVQLEQLVTFNYLAADLVRGRSTINYEELEKTVAAWNDPGWNELITLLRQRTSNNQEATKESFIAVAQRWEEEEWFQGNRMLRQFYGQITKKLGIELADLGIDVNGENSARGHVEFASAVVAKVMGSDPSRDEDPVSFMKNIKCPMLCIYGELDQSVAASQSAEIIRNVFVDTKHADFVIKVFPGAGHQLEITEGNRTFRHNDVDKFILDWIQKRVRTDALD